MRKIVKLLKDVLDSSWHHNSESSYPGVGVTIWNDQAKIKINDVSAQITCAKTKISKIEVSLTIMTCKRVGDHRYVSTAVVPLTEAEQCCLLLTVQRTDARASKVIRGRVVEAAETALLGVYRG
ncbi:MAG: hypothetical protein WC505_05585 [Patescibacteria group bacterium]